MHIGAVDYPRSGMISLFFGFRKSSAQCVKYQLLVLPFGWNRSPVIFQRLLSKYMSELEQGVIMFFPYILMIFYVLVLIL